MRMLMHFKFPAEPFNSAVRDGSAGAKIHKILEAIKPEAAYFTEQSGHRGGTFVVNVNSASDIPSLLGRAVVPHIQCRSRISDRHDPGRYGTRGPGRDWKEVGLRAVSSSFSIMNGGFGAVPAAADGGGSICLMINSNKRVVLVALHSAGGWSDHDGRKSAAKPWRYENHSAFTFEFDGNRVTTNRGHPVLRRPNL